jgi:hypothetical protein
MRLESWTEPSASGSSQMTLAELAQLAGVSRPAVTNWRRRYADFPSQVAGNAAHPLFDTAQVTQWLLKHPGLGNVDHNEVHFNAALYSLAGYTDRFHPSRLLEITSALLCLRALDSRDEPLVSDEATADFSQHARMWDQIVHAAHAADSDDEFLWREIRAADPSALDLAVLADALAEAAYSAGQAHERLLESRTRLGLAELTASALTPQAVTLIAELCGARQHLRRHGTITIADFYAGAGDVLHAVLAMEGHQHRVTVLGAEADPQLTRLLRRRMLMDGVSPAQLDVRQGGKDGAGAGFEDADVMIACLPYLVGERRDVAEIFTEIARFLHEPRPQDRTVVVLGPADALTGALDRHATAQLRRRRLLSDGLVEAIVRLPGGIMPFRPGYQTAIWILREPQLPETDGRVLVCDVSTVELSESVVRDLAADVLHWRDHGFDRSGRGRTFRHGQPRDLQDVGRRPAAVIEPSRRTTLFELARVIPEQVERIREAEAELAELESEAARTRGPLDGVIARRSDAGSSPGQISVGAMIANKRLALIPGLRLSTDDTLHDLAPSTKNAYQVLGKPEVLGHIARGKRRVDALLLAARYGHYQPTQAGDLVVVMGQEPVVAIDEEGSSVVEFPARVLRILPARRDQPSFTPRVLAALLEAARGTERAGGAVRGSRKLNDLNLPELSTADIRAYDRLLKDLGKRRALLRSQLATLDTICQLAGGGIADGILTITPAPILNPVDLRSIDATA